jgi:hypothetical protein
MNMSNIIDSIYKYIADSMQQRGFTVTTRPTEVVGQHSQHTGLRFIATTYNKDHHLDFIVKRRTSTSGYINLMSRKDKIFDKIIITQRPMAAQEIDCPINKDTIELVHAELAAIVDVYDQKVVPILENGYPDPYIFLDHSIYRIDGIRKWILTKPSPGWTTPPTTPPVDTLRYGLFSQLREAEVCAIVTINHGYGTINVNQETLFIPNTECWFLLEVVGHSYATGNLVTDGKRYWPVTRINKHDIPDTKPIKILSDWDKATLNIQLSLIDQQLITAAIHAWCQRYFS